MEEEENMTEQNREADLRHAEAEMEEEAARITAGPGMIATKSQTRGGAAGIVGGGFIGIVLGLIIGFIFFDGAGGILVSAACGAFAGGTVGVLVGGIVPTRDNVGESSHDADV
jgi:uncharacterized membrane protein